MRELQLTTSPPSFSDMPPAHSTFVSKVVLFARQQHSTSPKTFWTMHMYYKVWFWRKGGKEEEPFVMHNFAFPSRRRRPRKHKSPGQKKIRGKGEFIQKKKGGGRGGYFWNPCRPCLPACIVMLARIKKSTHIRRLLLSLFLTWHIWPPAKAHLAIKSEKREYNT